MKKSKLTKALNSEDWASIWVPIAVELVKNYLIPLIFGKKATKRTAARKLIRGRIVEFPGVNLNEIEPKIVLVSVDERQGLNVNKVMRLFGEVARTSRSKFIVFGNDVKTIAAPDRFLKRMNLQRIDPKKKIRAPKKEEME